MELTKTQSLAEEEEDLEAASQGHCERAKEHENASNDTHPAKANPRQHHAPIALKSEND